MLLIVNLVLPLVFLMILGALHLLGFDGINWNGNVGLLGSIKYNVEFTLIGIPMFVLLFVFTAFVKSWFEAAFIRVLAVFTKLGNLKLGYSSRE